MQVSLEQAEGLERRMTVTLAADEIEAEVQKRMREMTRTLRLPGFRPGKVPPKVLRQRFGDQIEHEVVGERMRTSLPEALASVGLAAAGAPDVVPNIDVKARVYGYTAVFEVLPEITLAGLEDRVIKRPVAEVTDADLDEMVQRLRTQHRTWETVERAADRGDRLTVDYTGTLDGSPFEGGSATGHTMELGAAGMIPGFEDGLIGATAAQTRTLNLRFPEDFRAPHLRGQEAVFTVTVQRVEAPVLPEVDAELARKFDIADGDVERFLRDVRANMERELRQRITGRIKQQVMDVLLEANPIQVPRALMAQEIEAVREDIKGSMGIKATIPDALVEPKARRRAALGLIIGKIVADHDIQVDAERVRAAVADLAATDENPQEVVDYYYASRERLAQVESLTMENQVVDFVLGRVKVEDEPLTFAALTEPAAS